MGQEFWTRERDSDAALPEFIERAIAKREADKGNRDDV
jgi:hypothetical protein